MKIRSSCCSSSCKKYSFSVGASVVIALVIATLSVIPQQAMQIFAAYATHFFTGFLLVLATAGFLKYLICCQRSCKCCGNTVNGTGSCSTEAKQSDSSSVCDSEP